MRSALAVLPGHVRPWHTAPSAPPSPPLPADSLTTPIVQTATYTFQDTAELIAYQEGRYGSYEYGRYGNPTTRACEEKIRELEGAEDCLVSSSGMNSATTMLLALVPAGGHIVTTTDCSRRTRQVRGARCKGCRVAASGLLGVVELGTERWRPRQPESSLPGWSSLRGGAALHQQVQTCSSGCTTAMLLL